MTDRDDATESDDAVIDRHADLDDSRRETSGRADTNGADGGDPGHADRLHPTGSTDPADADAVGRSDPGTGSPALAVRGLVAGYRGVPVVHGLDLDVAAGEVVALLGANGAGKTTTLLALSGLADVLGGTVDMCGVDAPERRRRPGVRRLVRAGLAHVPERRALFPSLTGRQTLRLAVPRRRTADALAEATGWFPALGPVLDRPAGALSGGEQQMLALARALVTRPRVLLIDEMSLGLAPLVVEALLPVVRGAADDHRAAVVLVEQHAVAALEVADRAVVLRGGRVAVSAPAATLRGRPDALADAYLGEG